MERNSTIVQPCEAILDSFFPFGDRRPACHPCDNDALRHLRKGIFRLQRGRRTRKKRIRPVLRHRRSPARQAVHLLPDGPIKRGSPVWSRTVVPPDASVAFITSITSSRVMEALS